MTRSTAMKVRMDLAIKTDPASIDSVLATSRAIENLKQHALRLGFILAADVSAKVGTHEFPPEAPVDDAGDPPASEG